MVLYCDLLQIWDLNVWSKKFDGQWFKLIVYHCDYIWNDEFSVIAVLCRNKFGKTYH